MKLLDKAQFESAHFLIELGDLSFSKLPQKQRQMLIGWGGRWEGGSGLGTSVQPWWIHVDIWQNQYNIVKQENNNNKIKYEKKRK